MKPLARMTEVDASYIALVKQLQVCKNRGKIIVKNHLIVISEANSFSGSFFTFTKFAVLAQLIIQ